jgi:hypothetical protein
MSERHAQVFDGIRGEALTRLLEARGSIDDGFARLDEHELRGQLGRVLDKMRDFLLSEQPEPFRDFVSRWMAVRVSEGATPEQVIHALVAIGDVVAQVAQRSVGHTPEGADFVRATMRTSLAGVRLLAAGLADELEARYARRRELRAEGRR